MSLGTYSHTRGPTPFDPFVIDLRDYLETNDLLGLKEEDRFRTLEWCSADTRPFWEWAWGRVRDVFQIPDGVTTWGLTLSGGPGSITGPEWRARLIPPEESWRAHGTGRTPEEAIEHLLRAVQ